MELTEIEKEMFGLCESDPIEDEQPQQAAAHANEEGRDSESSSASRRGRPQRKSKSKKNHKLNRLCNSEFDLY